jgi:uncharacterized protein YecE (DUF72 family)
MRERYDYCPNAMVIFQKGMKQETNIHIGTSGWSYKHWANIFYPPEVKPANYLSYYAQHFAVTELNASFYRLPLKSTVEKWLNTVPENFLFCPKMSRYLSHLKKLHDPEEPLRRFFDIFEPVKHRLGPVLVQLPAGVQFDQNVVEHFYELIREQYPEYRFAMEVRHESWFTEASLGMMRKHRITLVIAQSEKFPYHEELTAKDVFVRFHGPEQLYSSSYSESVLQDYARKLVEWKKEGHNIWAFFNNDIHGHALKNATMLQQYVDEFS